MNFNKKIIGISCIILAQFSFTTNDMGMKFVSGDYALHQIVFTRSLVAIIFTFIILDLGMADLDSFTQTDLVRIC